MIGWPDDKICSLACRLGDESQQPTWPQVRHRRKCTQREPILKHSSHPFALGVTGRIIVTCGSIILYPYPRFPGRACSRCSLSTCLSRRLTASSERHLDGDI